MAGSASGGRFVVTFAVDGPGKGQLKEIADLMDRIASKAGYGANGNASASDPGLAGGLEKSTGKLKSLWETMKGGLDGAAARGLVVTEIFENVSNVLSSVMDTGQWLTRMGMSGFGFFEKMGRGLLEQLAPIENSIIRMSAIGDMSRENATKIIKGAQEIVQYTPYEEQMVIDLTQALVSGKVAIDQFNDSTGKQLTLNAAAAQGWTKLDQKTKDFAGNMHVTSTSLMLDLAAMTGQTGERMWGFVRGMERALTTGQMALLSDQLPAQIRKRIFGTMTGAKMDAGKAIQNLYEYLKEKHAIGTSALASATYSGIMSNFKDFPRLLARMIGGMPGEPGSIYDKMVGALARLQGVLINMLSGDEFKEFQNAIKTSVVPILEAAVTALDWFTGAISRLANYVKDNPQLVKYAVGLTLIGSAFLLIAGVITTVVAGFLGLVTALAGTVALVAIIAPVMGTILPVLVGIGAAVAAATVAAVAFGAAIAGIAYVFGPEITQTLEGLWTLLTATWEALGNWNNGITSISKETYDSLQKVGMLDTFLTLSNWIRQAESAWQGFSGAIKEAWQRNLPQLQVSWDRLRTSATQLWDAVGKLLGVLFGVGSVSEENVSDANSWGKSWGEALGKSIDKATSFIGKLTEITEIGTRAFVDVLPNIISFIAYLGIAFNMLQMLARQFMFVGQVVMDAMLAPLRLMLDMITGIVQMISSLAKGDLSGATSAMTGSLAKIGNDLVGRQVNNVTNKVAGDAQDASDIGGWMNWDAQSRKTLAPQLAANQATARSEAAAQNQLSATIQNKMDLRVELDGEVLAQKIQEWIKKEMTRQNALP